MAKPRSYVSNLRIRFGPAQTQGQLLPIRRSIKTKLHYCTPEGAPVKQCYVDDAGKTYFKDELGRATKDEEGNLHRVDADAIAEAKSSNLPLNSIMLTPHHAEDIERYLYPSDNNAYIFNPVIKNNNKVVDDPVNVQWHDFINVVVRDSGLVFLGMCNLSNHEGLFRLSHYQGYLVLQKQLYPEELNQYEAMHPTLEPKVRKQALDIAQKLAQPFDPEAYKDEVEDRVREVAAAGYDESNPIIVPKPEPEVMDLSEALDSFLASQ